MLAAVRVVCVYPCFPHVCARDICHRKPHNGPSHRDSPIVDVCCVYVVLFSPPLPPSYPTPGNRPPPQCTVHRASMKPMHQSSRLQVSIRSTQKPSSLPPLVAGLVGYQEINRRFVRILYYTVERNRTRSRRSAFRIWRALFAATRALAFSNPDIPRRALVRVPLEIFLSSAHVWFRRDRTSC